MSRAAAIGEALTAAIVLGAWGCILAAILATAFDGGAL